MKKQRLITIEPEQDQYIRRKKINLSKEVQKLIEGLILLEKFNLRANEPQLESSVNE